VEDLLEGRRLPPTDALVWTVDGGRTVLRPSGTEPKLKCYLEVVEPVGDDIGAARAAAGDRLAAIRADLAAATGL
jgi:phosphomannomutase